MSRMVKKKLQVVSGLTFNSCELGINVSNSNGTVFVNTNGLVNINVDSECVKLKTNEKEDNGMLGTTYVTLRNAMNDLTQGYVAKLKMVGVGFKANVKGSFLNLYIGLSHDVVVAIPKGLSVSVDADVEITIKGYNRTNVMQFARTIRDLKKPEPYKGKGIFLNNEKILRKEGKKK